MIGHFSEIIYRFRPGRAGVQIAEDLRGTIGEYVKYKQIICKIESGIAGIECPEQSGSNIELMPESLSAIDGAIFALFHILGGAAGQAMILLRFFLPTNHMFGCCFHIYRKRVVLLSAPK